MDNIKYGQRVLSGEGTRSFTNEVKEVEIRVCTTAIEHNRPFNSFNHYVLLTQSVCKNPNVLKRMSLSGKKMKAICLNVINKSIDKIMKKMQGKYFSVLIGETTDVSNLKLLCFLIRYVNKEKICTDLLNLIRINEATAEKLYDYFRQSLEKFNLPISNKLCLSLPHSNADVERFFSIVTQIKTRDRNRLHPETLAALTRIKLDMSNQNAHCYDYNRIRNYEWNDRSI